MNKEEQVWVEDAMRLCQRAKESGITIALVRCQDVNDEADIVVTNANSPEALQAMSAFLRASGTNAREV